MATSHTTISATPAEIMAVLADLPGMAVWSAAKSVEVLQHQPDGRPVRARWREDYGPIPDEFVLDYTWDADRSVSWRLIEGRILKREDGRYELTPNPSGGTDVTFSMELGVGVWMLPPLWRRIESGIVSSGLDALKKHIEG